MHLLRKKRPSSTPAATVHADDEHEHEHEQVVLPALSPSSSRTSNSTPSFTTPTKRNSDNLNVSPLKRRLSSPINSMRSMVSKKVKRSIQRLDEAFHHVILPKTPPRAVTPSPGRSSVSSPSAKSSLSKRSRFAVSFPSNSPHFSNLAVIRKFPQPPSTPSSTRKRTLSTPKEEALYYEKLYREIEQRGVRHRTSCPTLRLSERSVTFSTAPPPPPKPQRALMPSLVPSAEQAAKGGEEQASSTSETRPAPPAIYLESDDPFLVDEEGDALSEDESEDEDEEDEDEDDGDSASLPIAVSASPSPVINPLSPRPASSALQSPNINKDVPPPPVSDIEEDEIPEMYLPGLVIPTMFLPIPNTDPLTILLNKYIYPPEKRPVRDVSGGWQHSDFHTLVMTNSWRSLARMARDRIVASDPADLNLILGLWHLRLSCLARLRLFNQTAAECTNLFTVLNGLEPPEARAYLFDRVLPFELEVMQTRLKYWSGDHMGYLDALSGVLAKCRVKAREEAAPKDGTAVAMWKERGARVALIMASQLVEMKEFTAAAHLLEPLCVQKEGGGVPSNPALRSAVARIYLQGGNVRAAAKHFAAVDADPAVEERQKRLNAALLASAEGDWARATETLKEMIEKDNEDYVAVNNLSVALLSQGKLKEGIEVLEAALQASPSSVVVAEPFLFNLSTLYELRSSIGFEKKRELLVEVAKWSGDGLKASCLKLPSN